LHIFRAFPGLARLLKDNRHRLAKRHRRVKKGDFRMSGQSQFTRSFVAVVGALLVSSITIGAAVAPAQAVAHPISNAIGKTRHA
jgi:hypothetical protein